MLISLGLRLGPVTAHAAGTTPLPPPETGPGTDTAITVTPFSRDMSVFDSDLARGNNAASIPLSGTTDAADGARIEARIVRGDTGAEVHPWAVIGDAGGGAWTGTYFGVPWSPHWLRPEIRVQGSSETATTSNRFGVGLVVAQEDQSNVAQGLRANLEPLTPPTIGNAPGDFQIIYPNMYRTDWSGGNSGIIHVHDGNPTTASVATMAQTVAQTVPGLKVVFAPLVLGGSHMRDLLDDEATRRPATEVSNAEGTGVIDIVTADGSEVGIFDYTREAELVALYCLGTDREGNVIVPSQTEAFPRQNFGDSFAITRVMSSLIPGLATGRTKIGQVLSAPLSWIGEGSPNFQGTSWMYGVLDGQTDYEESVSTIATPFHYGMTQEAMGENNVNIHYSGSFRTGMPYKWAGLARGYLDVAGFTDSDNPQFDMFEAAPDGSKVTVWSSSGPVTTKVRHEDGNSAENFPVNPTVDPAVKREAEVLGFMSINSAGDYEELVTKIVDADGNPAAEGRIEVYPPAGESWGPTSQGRFFPSGSYGVLRPDPFDIRDWVTQDDVWSWHMPVVRDPTFPNSPFGGTVMPPPENPVWLTDKISEAYAFDGPGVNPQVTADPRPSYVFTSPSYSNQGSMTWEMRMVASPDNASIPLWACGGNYARNGGLTFYGQVLTLAVRSGGGTSFDGPIWSHSADGYDLYGQDIRLLIEWNRADAEARVYYAPGAGGAYSLVATEPTGDGFMQIVNAIEWLPPRTVYGGWENSFNGLWMYGRHWVNPSTQDGTPPTDPVDYGLEETDGAGTPTLGGGSLELLEGYQRPV